MIKKKKKLKQPEQVVINPPIPNEGPSLDVPLKEMAEKIISKHRRSKKC